MNAILERIARNRSGGNRGIYSVCSAHPIAIEAALIHALRNGESMACIEATSNQVNQDGGYTGMPPAVFRDFVYGIADGVGIARSRVVLGGDHLGPNPWQDRPAKAAMSAAETMVSAYVAAGFRKIHLDCSMSCADDKGPLHDETIARRSAQLCAAAERAWSHAGGEPPVYVIGTEVPVPGGAAQDLHEIDVTTPASARATIDKHREIFAEAGLGETWGRVIAAVVQPGVEFTNSSVVDYDARKTGALCRVLDDYPGIVFEAHSTDYQTPAALAQLVRDHFAILKVGPAVTFAVREALWALDAIERDWIDAGRRSRLRETAIERMKADPRHWSRYYTSSGAELDFDLQYSLSDRIRYYWGQREIVAAQDRLFANLTQNPPPLALISQYLPSAFRSARASRASLAPKALVVEHVRGVLEGYSSACMPAEGADA
jgi:D-tagatose-1,6-bisphosphate aldolase subunit GatZ/KbaZ